MIDSDDCCAGWDSMNAANSSASVLCGEFSGTATPRMPPITTPHFVSGKN